MNGEIIKKEDAKYVTVCVISSTDPSDKRRSVSTSVTRVSIVGHERTHNSYAKDQNDYGKFVRETKAKGEKLISKTIKSMLLEEASKVYSDKREMRLEVIKDLENEGYKVVSGDGKSPHDKF